MCKLVSAKSVMIGISSQIKLRSSLCNVFGDIFKFHTIKNVNSFLFLQRNECARINKKAQAFIFIRTYALLSIYQVVFYNYHNLGSIPYIYVAFTQLQIR